MFRFTIRDVLWLTVVVAMGVGWWVSHLAEKAKQGEIVAHAVKLRNTLEQAKPAYDQAQSNFKQLLSSANMAWSYTEIRPPDWKIIGEPIPGQ